MEHEKESVSVYFEQDFCEKTRYEMARIFEYRFHSFRIFRGLKKQFNFDSNW